jgi:hypothetical protein
MQQGMQLTGRRLSRERNGGFAVHYQIEMRRRNDRVGTTSIVTPHGHPWSFRTQGEIE